MSLNEFWHGDPKSFWAYRFSYIQKIKREYELANEIAWLNGLYFYNALTVALSNMWCKKESDLKTYIERPIDFNKKPKSKEELIREEREKVENGIKEQLKKAQELLKKAGDKNG